MTQTEKSTFNFMTTFLIISHGIFKYLVSTGQITALEIKKMYTLPFKTVCKY